MASFVIVLILVIIAVARSLLIRRKWFWIGFTRPIASGSLPLSVAVMSIFSSLVGGFLVFGIIQVGLTKGFQGFIWGLAYIVGIPLIVLLSSRVFSDGVPRGLLFGLDLVVLARYGRLSLAMFYVTFSFLFLGVLAGQFLGLAFVAPVFDNFLFATIIIVVGVVGTTAYTAWFGLRGVLANDVLQACLIVYLGIFLPGWVAWSIFMGSENDIDGSFIDAASLAGATPWITSFLGAAFLLLSFSVRADIWVRLRLVEARGRKSCAIFSGVAIFMFFLAGSLTAWMLAANGRMLGIPLDAPPIQIVATILRPEFGVDFVGGVLKSLAIAGVLYVLLSSIDSYMNISGAILTRLLNFERASEEAETPGEVYSARILSVGVAAGAIALAWAVPDIVQLLQGSFSLMAGLVPLFLVRGQWSDFVGVVPQAGALFVLILGWMTVGDIAFVPAAVAAWVLFGCCAWLGRGGR